MTEAPRLSQNIAFDCRWSSVLAWIVAVLRPRSWNIATSASTGATMAITPKSSGLSKRARTMAETKVSATRTPCARPSHIPPLATAFPIDVEAALDSSSTGAASTVGMPTPWFRFMTSVILQLRLALAQLKKTHAWLVAN